MIIIAILIISITLQVTAVFFSVRHIRLTGKQTAWALIAVALMLMAIRRLIPLYHLLSGDSSISPDPLNEFVGLALSLFMMIGVWKIGPLFIERKQREEILAERVMLAELSADIGNALAKQGDLRCILNACAEALVRHLDVAFARIWVLNAAENVLELQASAGMYTSIDGSHSRVPVGKFKIGLIAEERKPHITNAVIGDPLVHDQEWAKREGMVAFAGHPLLIEDKLVGVMALFSRKPLSDITLKALSAGSTGIAIGIERKLADEALHRLNRKLRAISNCNQTLLRAGDEQALLNDICRIVCDEAGYRMAWVGYAENDGAANMRPVAWAGAEDGYLEQNRPTWADTERGSAPGGTAPWTGESVCIQDITTDPQTVGWRDSALQQGYRSCIALPLRDESKNIFGILNIYSSEPNAFTTDEMRLLEELAGDLAFGIMVLRSRLERRSMEQERLANLMFFESMDQINRAIQGTDDLQQMMSDVLKMVLNMFDCDRVWLLYPCDPEALSFRVPMEITKPEYLGAKELNVDVPMSPDMAQDLRVALESIVPVTRIAGTESPINKLSAEQFGVQSQMFVTLYPKLGKPWVFGLHQCSYPRVWTLEEKRLFQEIGRRLTDALSSLLSHRNLQESEEKYRRIVDTANEGIWMLGEDLTTIFVNARMAEMLGYSIEEILGRPVTDFMFEEDKQDHLRRMENRRQGLSEHYERRYQHKNGQTVWTLSSAVPIMDAGNNFIGTFAMFTDITERKRSEQALEQSATEWSAAMDATEDIIYLLDIKRHLIRANKGFYDNIGKAEETAIGKHIAEILHPDVTGDLCPVCRAQEEKNDTVLIMEKDHICNPFKRPLEATVRIISDSHEQPASILTMIHDLSRDRKIQEDKTRLEKQLYQSQKMEAVGQLAGGIAHDFNNILTAIIGYGSLALMKMAKNDLQRLNIEHMLESAERATHLTKDLLLFSRKQISEREPVNLNEIINKMEKFLNRIIGEDISFKTILHPGEMTVLADAHQIEQVIMNLATNARDAMPNGGVFSLTTEPIRFDKEFLTAHGYGQSGMYALITVSDTGKGIDKAIQHRIFEPFFTTKEIGKGTGLGLSVVYGIVKEHDGYLNVYSEPGLGTTFKIYLPLTSMAAEMTPESIQPPPLGKGETILITEDEPDTRRVLRLTLEEYGYSVIEAENGEDAVKQYRMYMEKISLVLLDVIMPVKNGMEAFNEIKNLTPDIKVIFMSGYTNDIITAKRMPESGTEFIQKPITPDSLLRKVREVLDR